MGHVLCNTLTFQIQVNVHLTKMEGKKVLILWISLISILLSLSAEDIWST